SGPKPPDLLEQREPVHDRHLDVAHDRVVVDLPDPLERVRRRLRGVDLDPLRAEADRRRQRLEERDVVVDEQDPRLVHRSGSSGLSPPEAGTSTMNVAPPPGVGESEISPPCSLTMLYVIESPRPVPVPTSFVVKNGSKTREAMSAGIPGPVSWNTIRMR